MLHAAGGGPREALQAVLRDAREATQPTLVVVDDADRAGADERAELERLAGAVRGLPVLLLAEGEQARSRLDGDAALEIELEPLDAAAVEAIARAYAADHGGRSVPVGALFEASHGVPSAVHEAAGEWARRDAADRVSVAAEEAADGRSRLRTKEAEVVEGVVDLQRARERAALPVDPEGPVVCPFKGLACVRARGRGLLLRARAARGGAGRAAGRRAAARDRRRVGHRQVLGPARRPASRTRGRHPAGQRGVAARDDPARAAAAARARPRAGNGARPGRLLIAVDQFEEVFTVCDDERERVEFIGRLVAAARDPLGRSVVVLTIRADQYERCAAYPELSDLLAADHVLVTPMRRDELRDAVERPALRVGLRVEPALADALVADVEGEPGALPLLSTALLELWRGATAGACAMPRTSAPAASAAPSRGSPRRRTGS